MDQPDSSKASSAVTDAYRKAHKNYVLASGLFAAWELIGITLDTKGKWGIELKSPAGVPLVLFILVVYFSYNTWIEWLQCDVGARSVIGARIDYRVAHGIAVSAIGVSLVQYLWRIQIANVINSEVVWTAIGGFALGGAGVGQWQRIKWDRRFDRPGDRSPLRVATCKREASADVEKATLHFV